MPGLEARDRIFAQTTNRNDLIIEGGIGLKFDSVPGLLYALARIGGTDFLTDAQRMLIASTYWIPYVDSPIEQFENDENVVLSYHRNIWTGIDDTTNEPIPPKNLEHLRGSTGMLQVMEIVRTDGWDPNQCVYQGCVPPSPAYFPGNLHLVSAADETTYLVYTVSGSDPNRHRLSKKGVSLLARVIVDWYGKNVIGALAPFVKQN